MVFHLARFQAECVSLRSTEQRRRLFLHKLICCWQSRASRPAATDPASHNLPSAHSYLAIAMAWRTWPVAFLRAATAWGRVALAASITSATGVRLPDAFKVRVADS